MGNQKDIKLFVDAHTFDNEYQGTRTFIKEIYAVLALKPDLKLFIAANNIENLEANFPSGMGITFIQYKNTGSIKRLLFDIPGIIKKHQIDYAHFQYIIPFVKKCRYIVTIHDVLFNDYPQEFSFTYRFSRRILFGFAAWRSNIITTVSKYSRETIKKFLNIGKKELLITPNGVNENFFQPYDKAASRELILEKYGIGKYILYVSRFEPRKNQALLLKSYLDLKLYEKGYYLVLLGFTSIKIPELERLINELPDNVKPFIMISSEVNDADLLHFYKAAAAFVYPSKAEGFGIPPLEAAAFKIPVLCSDTTAMRDFDFFGAYHVNPDNEKLFREKLLELITTGTDEAELERISGQVRERYTWAQSAEVLYQAIRKDFYSDNSPKN